MSPRQLSLSGSSKNILIDKKSLLQIPWLGWSHQTLGARTKRYKKSWTNWRNSNVNKMTWPRRLMRSNVTSGMPWWRMMSPSRLPMSPSGSSKEISHTGQALDDPCLFCYTVLLCITQSVVFTLIYYNLQGERPHHGSSSGRDH